MVFVPLFLIFQNFLKKFFHKNQSQYTAFRGNLPFLFGFIFRKSHTTNCGEKKHKHNLLIRREKCRFIFEVAFSFMAKRGKINLSKL